MAKILVTGADGFIGSHLVEALVRDGAEVRAFVLYNSFNSWGWLDRCAPDVAGRFEVFAGDIRDPHGVRAAMRGCDTVFHLAALIAIPYSYHSPDTYVDTNVKGTLNVVQAARDAGARVVHTSTSEVYGTARYVPIDEAHPLQGQSPYSASKIDADQMALAFHRNFDVPVTVARPFNTYGMRQSARAVIPTVITQLAAGRRTIRLGALHPTRDFSFVADTVAGFRALAASRDAVGRVVNLGAGFEVSIGEHDRRGHGRRGRDRRRRRAPAAGGQRGGAALLRHGARPAADALAAGLWRDRRLPPRPGRDGGLVRRPGQPGRLQGGRLQHMSGALRVLAVTGGRADWGLLRSPLRLMRDDPAFDLRLAATGSHLDPAFGLTVGEIEAEGFRVDARVPVLEGDDAAAAATRGLGRGLAGFAEVATP